MLGPLTLLLALAGAATEPDPCASAPPRSEAPDPATARAYADVGAAELEAGHPDVAIHAFERAVALDAALESARAGLRAACTALREDGRSSEKRGAEEAFAVGVERFRAGEDRQAVAAFDRAARWPALVAPAGLYRALAAVRAEDWPEARRQLTEAERDPALADGVATLRRLAARRGRLVLSAGDQFGYDDNVELLPDAPPTGSTRTPRGDGHFMAVAGAVARPVRGLGLRLEQAVSWRNQLDVDALDLITSTSDASLRLPIVEGLRARIGSGLDYLVLGGQSYLLAPQGGAGIEVDLGNSASVGAGYRFRWRDFRAPAFAGFTGATHEGTIGAGIDALHWLRVDVVYRLASEGAQDAVWAVTSHGPSLDLGLRPIPWLRLFLHSGFRHRTFDRVDPNVGFRRVDDEVAVDLRIELDLRDRVVCHLGGGLLRNASNVVDFEFTRRSVLGGFTLVVGFF